MNFSYLFKHWFATLTLAPIISEIINLLFIPNSNKIVGLLEVYPIAVIFGFIFSIPTYIIYFLVYYLLGSKNINIKTSKLILITLAVIGIIISFSITFNNREPEITIAYILSSIISGIIFKLNFKNDHNKTIN
jgi:surface polysaccharide O-acyltransferase-like enzyme